MNAQVVYLLAGIGVFAIGLIALIRDPHLFRKIMAVNVMGTGVFLILLTLAARVPDGAPDPISHAMVLTGIVVSVSATAVGLALAKKYHHMTGRTSLPGEGGEE